MRLSVLTRISRSYGKAQNPLGKCLSWLIPKTPWRIFSRFPKQNNPNWSLTILLLQIRKFRINLASLLAIGLWFHSLIHKLDVFNRLQKGEFLFPVLLCNQRNWSEKTSYAAKTKNIGWRCPILCSLVFVKNIFVKIENFPFVLKNGFTFNSSQ